MEWEQIADKWAAMTHRLRSDRTAAPRNSGSPLAARRATKGADRNLSDKTPPQTVANDRSLPSEQ